jgi:hypothetical protein
VVFLPSMKEEVQLTNHLGTPFILMA